MARRVRERMEKRKRKPGALRPERGLWIFSDIWVDFEPEALTLMQTMLWGWGLFFCKDGEEFWMGSLIAIKNRYCFLIDQVF